jgi:hypothetical protein
MIYEKQEDDVYQSFISCFQDKNEFKRIEKECSVDDLLSKYNNEKCMNFCERIATQWILESLKLSNQNTETIELKTNILKFINKLVEHTNNSKISLKFRTEIAIYSYFLYFSGILFFIRKESKYLKSFQELVEKEMDNIDDNSLTHFLQFLKVYIDIVDPEVNNIEVFKELENCFIYSKYHDDIVFIVIQKEYDIVMRLINLNNTETRKLKEALINKLNSHIFPNLNKNYLNKNLVSIIESILLSGQARLYHIAGRENERRDLIKIAISKYQDNSFALLQCARILTSRKNNYKNRNNDNDRFDEESKSLSEEGKIIAKEAKFIAQAKNYLRRF